MKIDIIALIPSVSYYFINETSSKNVHIAYYFLQFLILLKWTNVTAVLNRIILRLELNETIERWMPFVNLILTVAKISHMFALIWNLVAVY